MANILIIDDEPLIRKTLKKNLELEGYSVQLAEDGVQGIQLCHETPVDIIILDIKMPKMSGLEVLKEIKKTPSYTEVIMITGHGEIESAIEAMKSGAFAYIRKPIDSDELEIEIKKAADRIELKKRLDEYTKQLEIQNNDLTVAQAKLESLYSYLRREYDIATHVFRNVIRNKDLKCKNVRILSSPVDVVCGDVALVVPKPVGGMYMLVGDFTGHGLSAAIGAIPVSEFFYKMTSKLVPLKRIIAEINQLLKENLPTGLFLSACLIELDELNGEMQVFNAGMPDIFVLRDQGGIKQRIKSSHLPLGIVDNEKTNFMIDLIPIDPCDRVYIYTDGVIESLNIKQEMFGKERLEIILNQTYENGSIIFERLGTQLELFLDGNPQHDDITIVEMVCESRKKINTPLKDMTPDLDVLSWQMSFYFKCQTLIEPDPLNGIVHIIENTPQFINHYGKIYLILSELFNNALDYGILQLDPDKKKNPIHFESYYVEREKRLASLNHGEIQIILKYTPLKHGNKLIIEVTDTGLGFNYQRYMSNTPSPKHISGRGIFLVRSICCEILYNEKGNSVKAVYVWE
ncbi:MAG: fused response regulator/phosphatase [Desulfobacterales bacterium]|nr:fused response regulator/phosphatase [Desulfobacterales bacterium]